MWWLVDSSYPGTHLTTHPGTQMRLGESLPCMCLHSTRLIYARESLEQPRPLLVFTYRRAAISCMHDFWNDVSQNLPANEATGHPLVNVNKRIKNNGVQKTQTLPLVHCGPHALEVTNLNAVASNLLRTCFKSFFLPNSIIFITELHLHVFLTLCSSSNLRKSL